MPAKENTTMKRDIGLLFIIALMLGSCHPPDAQKKVVLTLPFGKYYNWTNFESKQIHFAIRENELLIDTTYNLKPDGFKVCHSEKLENYPQITKFLATSMVELQGFQKTKEEMKCNNVSTFYLQHEDGTTVSQIK